MKKDKDGIPVGPGVSRRDFMKMSAFTGLAASIGGLVSLDFLSPSTVQAQSAGAGTAKPFTFAVMADHHTMGPKNNYMKMRVERCVQEINNLGSKPDFIMSIGDMVHDGSDEQMKFFDELIAPLKAPVKYITGEHDWYLDMGESYGKHYGKTTYSWDHNGVHFVALNTVVLRDFWTARGLSAQERMDIAGTLNHPLPGPFHVGEKQLLWLRDDLKRVKKTTPIIIFSHSPLYYYYKPWNFWTEDAGEVHLLLDGYEHVQVIHGHVHHIVKNQIGNIKFASSLSTGWPHPYPSSGLPAGSPKMPRANPGNIFGGLGWDAMGVDDQGDVGIKYEEWSRTKA
jgi:3',5'-cyclic AMP phosphodiesterase CpdA